MHKHPYIYHPDEYFDFGLAGEHPVEIAAWIGESEPGYQIPVSILYIKVMPTIKNPSKQVWDITEVIRKIGLESRYEDEVREHYLAARNKDWEAS